MYKDISNVLVESPKLKGRQIAKKLGLNKTEVNSYMHKNKDKFSKDENDCWVVNQLDSFTLTFLPKWMTANDFESVISELSNVDFDTVKTLTIIIPKDCSMLLIVIARLLSWLNQLADKEISVTVDLSSCSRTRSFFNRTGFYDCLNEDVVVLPNRPKKSLAKLLHGNSDTLVEFGVIEPVSRNKELIKRLGDIFIHHSSKEYATPAKTVFSEMIGNVKEHSESNIAGFSALQKYEGRRKHIQTVISDSGLGVAATLRTTLKEYHPKLFKRLKENTLENDIELVKQAFTTGGISRYGSGRGLGFKSSREHATKNSTIISIRQTTFNIEFNYVDGELIDISTQKELLHIDGTHICFDFFVEKTDKMI